MTSIAVFDVLTDVDSEIVKSNLTKLWIYELVAIRINPETNSTTCILQYIFHHPEEERSIKDIVDYLLSISNDGWIYYYPDIDVYSSSGSDDDEAVEISVDDIFTEEYQPAMGAPFGYVRFVIKKS
jgi:hypothetical protein